MRAGIETRPYAQSNVGTGVPDGPPYPIRRRHRTSSLLTLTYYFKKDHPYGWSFSYSNKTLQGLQGFSGGRRRSMRR